MSVETSSAELAQISDYQFKIKVETIMTKDSHFILEFASSNGVSIPNTLNECQAITGFEKSIVPCIKQSETEIRITCFLCDLAPETEYVLVIAYIRNPIGA